MRLAPRLLMVGAAAVVSSIAVTSCLEPDEPERLVRDYPPQMESWYGRLSPEQREGLETWYQWTAGNEKLFRFLAVYTAGRADFFKMALTPRATRFDLLGTMNNPDCTATQQIDTYGLVMDDCADPNEVGILGLRKFPNPKFEPAKWRSAGGYEGYKRDPQLEPPYLVGASCGICHIAFNPIRPPANPNEPEWENLLPAFGNQYVKESALFSAGSDLNHDDRFASQVLTSQPPGTSDTSRMATDHIDNPNAINPIQNLAFRPVHLEQMAVPPAPSTRTPFLLLGADQHGMKAVPHVLKDGADSVGLAGASLRVYLNIGMCSDYWLPHHDLINGREKAQQPFDIETARQNCYDWKVTERRLGNVESFLKTQGPLSLRDAPGGDALVTADQRQLHRGATVFATECARCHSSKTPAVGDKHSPSARQAWVDFVTTDIDGFLSGNFLSDDQAYPVASQDERIAIGTNAARTMGTNAIDGHIYAQFSSTSYKDRPAVGPVTGLLNPFTGANDLTMSIPRDGRGYYRTSSLVSVWATAPFLHNNSLGTYTGNPSVAGRIAVFNDAIEKLLWPARRANAKSIKVTGRDTRHEMGNGIELPVPRGTPIKLLANIDVRRLLDQARVAPAFLATIKGLTADQLRDVALKFNQVPDFVEDRGHTFGAALPDEDKRALIEFVKTL
jgi:hypothetical protein